VAEFVAQEEMYRFTGYWWSKDDRWLAYTRVDEAGVTLVNRYEIGAEGVTSVAQRYPFAGEANAEVRLFLLDRTSGETREIDWRGADEDYLVRVDFAPDGTLAFQRQSRDQQRLDLVFVDPVTLEQRPVLTERAGTWINLHSDLTFFEEDDRFLWTSERDGHRHLYLYRRDGTLLSQLTSGAWALADTNRTGGAVRGLDETRGQVWFLGHRDTPIEQHLYRVDLDGASAPAGARHQRGGLARRRGGAGRLGFRGPGVRTGSAAVHGHPGPEGRTPGLDPREPARP
jgi:dipeptidyl-peptidase-4